MEPPVQRGIGRRLRGLSLRSQALIFVGGALLLGFVVYYYVLSAALDQSFGQLQGEITSQRTDRAIIHLEEHAAGQREGVQYVAQTEDTQRYFQKDSMSRLEKAMDQKPALRSQDFVLVFDRHKNLAVAISRGPDRQLTQGLPEGLDSELFRHSRLLGREDVATVIYPAGDALFLISSSGVPGPGGSGPSPGWLVFGRRIGTGDFEQIRATTAAGIAPVESRIESPDESGYKRVRIVPTENFGDCSVFERDGNDFGRRDQAILVELENSLGSSPVQLFVDVPPVIYATAIEFRDRLFLITLASGLALIAFSLIATEYLFVRRIAKMDLGFLKLAESGDAAPHLEVSGGDEFARLAQSANRLLDALRRRRNETERQQQLLGSVLDSANEGIMAFRSIRNADGEIEDFTMVLANPAAERIVSRSGAEMIGRSLLTLFPGNREAGIFDLYVRVVESGQPEENEFFYEHDGLKSWFHSSSSPWNDGFVVTFEEISVRKQREEEHLRDLEEIERFNRAMIGREERILEMKTEVNRLRQRLGLEPAYNVDSRSYGA